MRINSITNTQYRAYNIKQNNNRVVAKPYSTMPTYQNAFYLPLISFKAQSSDINLIKQIVESLESNQLPVLQKAPNTSNNEQQSQSNGNYDIRKYDETIERKKQELTQEFVNKTRGVWQNPNATVAEKLNAVQSACTFIKEKEQKYNKPSTLGDYLNSLNLSVEMNYTGFSDVKLEQIFDESQKYWEKEYLPKHLETEKNRLQYLENFYEERPDLKKLKTFNDLSYQDQYFIAKYLEINNFEFFDDDPIIVILNNVSIKEKHDVLNEIRQKITLDTEVFNDMLNNVPDMTKDKNGLILLSQYSITGKNNDNKTNLLKMLLNKLNNENLFNDSLEKQIAYFESLDDAKLESAIKEVRQEWFNTYIPQKIEKEVAYQAYKNNIHVKNYEELKKINAQLAQINIKLDKISLSLTEFISNLDGVYAKFPNPIEDCAEIQKRTGIQLEALSTATKNLSSEEEIRLANAFKTDGIKYLDVLLNNTKDEATKVMIQDIKKVITEEKKPSAILSRIEGYGTMALMSGFLHGGMTSASVNHTVNALANSDIVGGTGVMSTATGGGISSFISPQGLALAAVAAGLYGITNANKVHKQFTDIYINGNL